MFSVSLKILLPLILPFSCLFWFLYLRLSVTSPRCLPSSVLGSVYGTCLPFVHGDVSALRAGCMPSTMFLSLHESLSRDFTSIFCFCFHKSLNCLFVNVTFLNWKVSEKFTTLPVSIYSNILLLFILLIIPTKLFIRICIVCEKEILSTF